MLSYQDYYIEQENFITEIKNSVGLENFIKEIKKIVDDLFNDELNRKTVIVTKKDVVKIYTKTFKNWALLATQKPGYKDAKNKEKSIITKILNNPDKAVSDIFDNLFHLKIKEKHVKVKK
jgi:hypothetical protein